MLQSLTIRNLTDTLIELKAVERFDTIAETSHKGNFTNLFGCPRSTAPSVEQIISSAVSYHTQDVSLRIEQFKTCKTNILPSAPQSGATVRLTFESDGQRYRFSTPTPRGRSVTLTALSANPKHEYTAVYLPEHSFLALYSSSDLHCWMKYLKDDTPLPSLSIPGTHNSPTSHVALPSVRCQAVALKEQLRNGIRFFDIRLQPESATDDTKSSLQLVHSAFPVSLTGPKYFRGFLDEIERYLKENPSEAVIMSLKREGIGKATDELLSRVLKQHYIANSEMWFTESRVPRLGEIRKKIVLIRRFLLDQTLETEFKDGWGIDASVWADNTPCAPSANGALSVQDFYEVLESKNIDLKTTYVEEQLARAAEQVSSAPGSVATSATNPILYVNFLSGSNFWRAECWPERIAAKLNPAIVDYLCRKHNEPDQGKKVGDGGTGIVICDWVGNNGDWDLVRCIVGMNSKLLAARVGL